MPFHSDKGRHQVSLLAESLFRSPCAHTGIVRIQDRIILYATLAYFLYAHISRAQIPVCAHCFTPKTSIVHSEIERRIQARKFCMRTNIICNDPRIQGYMRELLCAYRNMVLYARLQVGSDEVRIQELPHAHNLKIAAITRAIDWII